MIYFLETFSEQFLILKNSINSIPPSTVASNKFQISFWKALHWRHINDPILYTPLDPNPQRPINWIFNPLQVVYDTMLEKHRPFVGKEACWALPDTT